MTHKKGQQCLAYNKQVVMPTLTEKCRSGASVIENIFARSQSLSDWSLYGPPLGLNGEGDY